MLSGCFCLFLFFFCCLFLSFLSFFVSFLSSPNSATLLKIKQGKVTAVHSLGSNDSCGGCSLLSGCWPLLRASPVSSRVVPQVSSSPVSSRHHLSSGFELSSRSSSSSQPSQAHMVGKNHLSCSTRFRLLSSSYFSIVKVVSWLQIC